MFSFRQTTASVAVGLLLATGVSQAAERPAALKALEEQGLTIVQEFDAGKGLRGFAGMAGDQPIAVYVSDGDQVIVGTRLDDKGKPMDEATLQRLVAKPMSQAAWAQLENATWVRDGKADAPRVVYTFSDPNCPYCNRFWEAARPWVDAGKVQLRHVMVGIIRQDSPGKAAAILDAKDPSAALLENETRFDKGGIKPMAEVSPRVAGILDDNRELMLSLGFRGTPGIVVMDEQGRVKKYHGMPQANALADVLGPR